MFFSIPHPHYFSYKSNKEIKEIYWMTVLNGLALAMAVIFEPIYLFHVGFSLVQIMVYYVQVYCWYLVFMVLGATFAQKFGLKKSILIGTLFYPLYWLVLFLIGSNPWFYALAPFLFAVQKGFFWPAYNSLSALASASTQRGRQMGFIFTLVQLTFIAGPLVGGWISQTYGFKVLFIVASVLMISSSIPLFKTAEIRLPGSFSLGGMVEFAGRNKKNFFGYWGYAEDLMLMSLWPIFTFGVVKAYLGVGLINTFASLIAAVVMLYIGKVSDKKDKHEIIEASSFFYGITWIFRFVAVDTISIVVFDTLTKLGKGLVSVPMVSLSFEIARSADKGFVLLYTTFYELSLAVAKIVTALASILILQYTGNLYIVFGMVGVLTFFYSFLTKKIKIR